MKTAGFVPQSVQVTSTVKPGVLQRKCTCGGTCDSCRELEKEKAGGVIQRQASAAGRSVSSTGRNASAHLASQIHSAAQSGGNPLPATTRSTMQTRFGNRDFSGVRIHHGSGADHLARHLGADAFTVGNNIFFAGHRYDPASPAGQRLLAHELAHVVQQGNSSPLIQHKLEVGAPDTAAELEADRVAERVVSGIPAGTITASTVGIVQRQAVPCAEEACGSSAAPPPQACACPLPGGGERVILPTSEPLDVPAQKALATGGDLDYLLNLYRNAARHHALRTTHAGRSTDTERLWGLWRQGRTHFAEQAREAESSYRSRCSPDHIIELQVNGADNANNLRILQRDHNSRAGSQIAGQITRLRNRYLSGSVTANSFIEFTAARERPGTSPGPDVCLEHEPLLRPGGRASVAAGSRELRFSVGGNPVVIGYAANGHVDPDSRYAVAGLELQTVQIGTDGKAHLTARISPHVRRLPLRSHQAPINLIVTGPQPVDAGAAAPPLALVNAAADAVKLTFPHLSEATLTPALERGQLVASGNFTPSLPLLRFVQVHLEIRNEQFQGGVTVPADSLRQALPIPGLTIDPVTLAIAIADGIFSVTGGFGFRYGTFANGQVSASFTPAHGFAAAGNIDMHVPGIDQASGQAYVRQGRFGAHLSVGTNKVKFPGVRSANLAVDVTDGTLAGTGTILLAIPGLRDTRLQFTANSRGQYGITGSATGTIPGLRDPHVEIAYANGALSGTGTAGFVIPGFEGGNIVLRYAGGQFSGGASINYQRGRLSGRITANLTPAHRLSGGGELSYEIVPGLVGIVGLEIRENGTARVSGELRLPDPINLFPEYAFHKQLFAISIDIPIFGISFGSRSIGVIANIAAALNAGAGVGPGQLRHPHILAAFDPSSDQGPASFQAGAELYIPAYAELALTLSGGIGVSLLIVKAVGGIEATGAAGLTGALAVPIELHYIGGNFTVDGAAALFAQPHLRFQLNAFVNVVADLLLTTIDIYSKHWRLAGFEWGSDFRIGLRFPIHYVFGQPFNLSLNQIEFIAPQIDTRRLMRDLLPK